MPNSDLAEMAVRLCLRRGAEQADALAISQQERSANVFKGEVRSSESREVTRLTVRIFKRERGLLVNGRGSVRQALEEMVALAIANFDQVAPDKYVGPCDPERLAGADAPLDLKIYDDRLARLSAAEVEGVAKAAESSAVSKDARTAGAANSTFSAITRHVAFCSSHGFSGAYQSTSAQLSLSATLGGDSAAGGAGAGAREGKLFGTGISASHFLEEIDVDAAAASAVSQLTGAAQRPAPSGSFPVIFSPDAARELLFVLLRFCSGPLVKFLKGADVANLGDRISSPLITIVDDPLLPGGAGSMPFDHEGAAARRKLIIEKGVLKEYLLNSYYARALNRSSMGNAMASPDIRYNVMPSNAYLTGEGQPPGDIIKGVSRGLYVSQLLSSSVPVATNYTQGASGYWVEGGEFAYPVRAVTISAPRTQVFQNICAVGNDSTKHTPIAAPTLMISGMNIRPLT